MPAHTTPLVSGLWRGFYEQSGRRYDQEMTLEFADGLVRGDGRDGLGTFTIEGEYRTTRSELRLGWIKTYDGAHSVLYLGHIDGDDIAGAWSIPPWGNGDFALSPPNDTPQTRAGVGRVWDGARSVRTGGREDAGLRGGLPLVRPRLVRAEPGVLAAAGPYRARAVPHPPDPRSRTRR